MRIQKALLCGAPFSLFPLPPASGQTIAVATYNVEHFESHFEGHRLRKVVPSATTRPSRTAGESAAADGGPAPEPVEPPPTAEQAEKNALSGAGEAKRQQDVDLKELIDEVKHQNDEDNWEVAEVITDGRFNPDILVIEEGCSQENLTYFNEHWLHKAYGMVMTFPTNTTRNQHLC